SDRPQWPPPGYVASVGTAAVVAFHLKLLHFPAQSILSPSKLPRRMLDITHHSPRESRLTADLNQQVLHTQFAILISVDLHYYTLSQVAPFSCTSKMTCNAV